MPQLRSKGKKSGGWYKESERHALAAQGIRTTQSRRDFVEDRMSHDVDSDTKLVEYKGKRYNLNKEKDLIALERQIKITEGRIQYGSVPKAESNRVTERTIHDIKKDKSFRRDITSVRQRKGKKRFIAMTRKVVHRKDAHRITQEVEDQIVKDGKKHHDLQ